MMKHAAGTLLYRQGKRGLEVLLVHPSGNYNRGKPFSIPKGMPDEGEGLEEAARRETQEEAGVVPGDLTYIGHIDYTKSKKRVHCFLGPAPEQEPKAGSWEIDEARFMSLEEARRLIHPDQRPFLERLAERPA